MEEVRGNEQRSNDNTYYLHNAYHIIVRGKIQMTVKEYLRQYEAAEKIAGRLRTEYIKQMEMIDSIKSPSDNDGMPHGSSISNRTEEAAFHLIEAAKRYEDAELEAIKKRQQVFNLIWNVPGLKGDILYERYINLKKWEEVADTVHLSLRQVHNLHGQVLIELKDCILLHI